MNSVSVILLKNFKALYFTNLVCTTKFLKYKSLENFQLYDVLLFPIQVPGKFQLKGHERVKELSSLNVDREDQYLPRQRRDVTYVSRLQVRREGGKGFLFGGGGEGVKML